MGSWAERHLGVHAGIALCCALLVCAVTGESPAATGATANAPTEVGPSADAKDAGADLPAGGAQDDLESHAIGGRPVEAGSRDAGGPAKPRGGAGGPFSFLMPLAAVLVLLGLAFWAAKRYLPGVRRLTGSSAVRVLARTHLSPRQSIAVVKVGRRLLVVGQSADQLSSLGCIDDAEEVSEVLGQCESGRADSATASFQKVIRNIDREFESAAEEELPPVGDDMSRVRSELESLTRKVREVAAARK